MSEDAKKTADMSVDEWFAGDTKRPYDGPFRRKFSSGMYLEVTETGVVSIAVPTEEGENTGNGYSSSRIVLCPEHISQAKEWLDKTLAYLDKRQARLNADQV